MAENISGEERDRLLGEKVGEYEAQGYRVTDRKENRVEMVKEFHSILITVEDDGNVIVAPDER